MTTILFYNPPGHLDLSALPDADRAAITTDHARLGDADAVVFHLPTLQPIPELTKPHGQLWVLWSMESVINYPALADPALLAFFDIVMSYARGADVWVPYLPERKVWEDALRRPVPDKTEAAPAVLFQSSAINRSGRLGYAAELMKTLRIDSYGKVLTTRTLAAADTGGATKLATIGRYKFCLALENSICDDYVTEKFFEPLLAGTVPVYLGARNVDAFAPGENCYIDVRDFAGPAQLANHLKALDRDPAAYQRYLAWRNQPLRPAFLADVARSERSLHKLLDRVRQRTDIPKLAGSAFSYAPDRYGPSDPARMSVAQHIYRRPPELSAAPAAEHRARAWLARLRTLLTR